MVRLASFSGLPSSAYSKNFYGFHRPENPASQADITREKDRIRKMKKRLRDKGKLVLSAPPARKKTKTPKKSEEEISGKNGKSGKRRSTRPNPWL